MAKHKPKITNSSAQQRADSLVGRLNGGRNVAGTGPATHKLIEGITRGGKTGDPATNKFVSALSEPTKHKTVKRSCGPIMDRAKPKKHTDADAGADLTEEFLERLIDTETRPGPKGKQGRDHRGETLKEDERSLLDGLSEGGLEDRGPQQPSL